MTNESLHQKTGFGLKQRQSLQETQDVIIWAGWAPDGKTLAAATSDETLRLWNSETGELIHTFGGHSSSIFNVAWSPDGKILASAARDQTIRFWNVETGTLERSLTSTASVWRLAWAPHQPILVAALTDYSLQFWNTESWELLQTVKQHSGIIRSLAWSSDGEIIASGSDDQTILLWNARTGELIQQFNANSSVYSLVWAPNVPVLVSGLLDKTICLWNSNTGEKIGFIDSHNKGIAAIAFSADGTFFASKSYDGTIRIWRSDTWETVSILDGQPSNAWSTNLAFHPQNPVLATVGEKDSVICLWDLNTNALLSKVATTEVIYSTSAKVIIVGSSKSGKSFLGLRLAENEYKEEEKIHGINFWLMQLDQVDADAVALEEKRDITIWEISSQDQEFLINQLFLDKVSLVLILLDLSKGNAAFDTVEKWSNQLEKHLGDQKITKLLVGTKSDAQDTNIDEDRLHQILEECNFVAYYRTSAKLNEGISELRKAIYERLNWEKGVQKSELALLQFVEQKITQQKNAGKVVLYYSEFESLLSEYSYSIDEQAIDKVFKQLAIKGAIADTKLPTGERVLVLQIRQFDRYAQSLINAVRSNCRTIPALEKKMLISPVMSFPGIKPKEKLPRQQERIIVQCIVGLLIERGICVEYENLLIFPALLTSVEAKNNETNSSLVISYDFSVNIDNIYLFLIVNLALSEQFGAAKLWENRAEFSETGKGKYILSKCTIPGGFTHLDIYVSQDTTQEDIDYFLSFVNDYLHQHEIVINEQIELNCICGFTFSPNSICISIASGLKEIKCPVCERQIPINQEEYDVFKRDIIPVFTSTDNTIESISDYTDISLENQQKNGAKSPIKIGEIDIVISEDSPTQTLSSIQEETVSKIPIHAIEEVIITPENSQIVISVKEEEEATNSETSIKLEETVSMISENTAPEILPSSSAEISSETSIESPETVFVIPEITAPEILPSSSAEISSETSIESPETVFVIPEITAPEILPSSPAEISSETSIEVAEIVAVITENSQIENLPSITDIDSETSIEAAEIVAVITENSQSQIVNPHQYSEESSIGSGQKAEEIVEDSSINEQIFDNEWMDTQAPSLKVEETVESIATENLSSITLMENPATLTETTFINETTTATMFSENPNPMELQNGEKPSIEPLRILHLSGLYMQADTDPLTMLQPLMADLRNSENGLDCNQLDYLVVSGDLTNNATAAEFEKAQVFISELIENFQLQPERCIIVPGNHDLDWNQSVYDWKPKRLVDVTKLKKGSYLQQEMGFLVRDEEKYPLRLKNFAENFYHSFLQQEYPLAFEEQCIPVLFAESGVQFLAMNSCWEIDEVFPERASIHEGALARGLTKADEQIAHAKREGQLAKNAHVLRIAVWYHPVSGQKKIVNDSLLERLRQSGFRICLHGHVYEDREQSIGYLHPTWKIHVAATGSFGVPMETSPDSILRLYSLLEVAADQNQIKVHTRYLRKSGGIWEGWPVWPGQTRNERRTYYEIQL